MALTVAPALNHVCPIFDISHFASDIPQCPDVELQRLKLELAPVEAPHAHVLFSLILMTKAPHAHVLFSLTLITSA